LRRIREVVGGLGRWHRPEQLGARGRETETRALGLRSKRERVDARIT